MLVRHSAMLFELSDPMQTGAGVTGDARSDIGEVVPLQVQSDDRPALRNGDVTVRGGGGRGRKSERERRGRRAGRKGRGGRREERVATYVIACVAEVMPASLVHCSPTTAASAALLHTHADGRSRPQQHRRRNSSR